MTFKLACANTTRAMCPTLPSIVHGAFVWPLHSAAAKRLQHSRNTSNHIPDGSSLAGISDPLMTFLHLSLFFLFWTVTVFDFFLDSLCSMPFEESNEIMFFSKYQQPFDDLPALQKRIEKVSFRLSVLSAELSLGVGCVGEEYAILVSWI